MSAAARTARPLPKPALCPVIKLRNWIPAVAALNSFTVKPESTRVPRAQDRFTFKLGPHEGCSYCPLFASYKLNGKRERRGSTVTLKSALLKPPCSNEAHNVNTVQPFSQQEKVNEW